VFSVVVWPHFAIAGCRRCGLTLRNHNTHRLGKQLISKRLINLVSVESHNHRAVDDNHRSCHVTEFFELGQCARILRYVPLLELYALLRKILFRLIAKLTGQICLLLAFQRSVPESNSLAGYAEHSSALGINDDVLCHFSPSAGFVPLTSKR
jgi:hypothetical protein